MARYDISVICAAQIEDEEKNSNILCQKKCGHCCEIHRNDGRGHCCCRRHFPPLLEEHLLWYNGIPKQEGPEQFRASGPSCLLSVVALWISAVVNINSLERDGLHQAELCPRHTMKMNTKNTLIPDRSQPGITITAPTVRQVFWFSKEILQGTVKGKRKRGRQKKRWEDNIKEWTGMNFASSTRAAENRSRWKGIVENSSVVPRRPSKVSSS